LNEGVGKISRSALKCWLRGRMTNLSVLPRESLLWCECYQQQWLQNCEDNTWGRCKTSLFYLTKRTISVCLVCPFSITKVIMPIVQAWWELKNCGGPYA
jgi:hypothetical protein